MFPPIGKILIELGYVKEEQISEALQRQSKIDKELSISRSKELSSIIHSVNKARVLWKNRRLGEILVGMGVVTEDQIQDALKRQKVIKPDRISISDKEAASLLTIPSLINSALNIYDLLANIINCSKSIVNGTECILFICNETTGNLSATIFSDSLSEDDQPYFFFEGSAVGRVINTGEDVIINDTLQEKQFNNKEFSLFSDMQIESLIAVPVKLKGIVVGVLLVVNKKEDALFNGNDQLLLGGISNQIAIILDNIRLMSEVDKSLKELQKAHIRILQIEKLSAISEMASGIAHDFNNILAGIIGRSQLLKQKTFQMDDPLIAKSINVIEKAAADGVTIVERLRNFTAAPKTDEKFSHLNINTVILDVIDFTMTRWKNEAKAKGIKINLTSDLADVPLVNAQETGIREVLINLIYNAIDALPDGGDIKVSTCISGANIVIRVTDSGTGIKDSLKTKIFDPFFTSKDQSHSGLGLSISYGIIKQHAGTIEMESSDDEGTTILITLPGIISEDDQYNGKSRAQPRENTEILMIDDDMTAKYLMSEVLKDEGYNVIIAESGLSGLEKVGEQAFDIVIIKLNMHDLSGLEIARQIRSDDDSILIVIILEWDDEIDDQIIKEIGINLVIKKPYQINSIIGQINKISGRI